MSKPDASRPMMENEFVCCYLGQLKASMLIGYNGDDKTTENRHRQNKTGVNRFTEIQCTGAKSPNAHRYIAYITCCHVCFVHKILMEKLPNSHTAPIRVRTLFFLRIFTFTCICWNCSKISPISSYCDLPNFPSNNVMHYFRIQRTAMLQ